MKTIKQLYESLLSNAKASMYDVAKEAVDKLFDWRTHYTINPDGTVEVDTLKICGKDTTDQLPFCIKSVKSGNISLENLPLKSLYNLPETCNTLIIQDCLIESLEHLPAAKRLVISSCKELKSLEGLTIQDGGSIYIEYCNSIKEIPTLDCSPGSIRIFKCSKLNSVGRVTANTIDIRECKRFEKFEDPTLFNNISISDCENIQDINLEVSHNTSIFISNCPALKSIKISSDKSTGNININNNPELTSIEIPETVRGVLSVNGNPKLDGLEKIKTIVYGNLQLLKNAKQLKRADLKDMIIKGKIVL